MFCSLPFVVPCGVRTLVGTDIIMWFESSTLLENDLRAFSVARNEFVYTINQGHRRSERRSTGNKTYDAQCRSRMWHK
jgi:hypothetical protein